MAKPPYVAKLAAGGNPARPLLRYLFDHINSGKRSKRLVDPAIAVDGEPDARPPDSDRDSPPAGEPGA